MVMYGLKRKLWNLMVYVVDPKAEEEERRIY